MNTRKTVDVPELEHDAMMKEKYGDTVSPNGRLERRLVAALCTHLAEHGWRPCKLWDREEITPVTDTKSAMELIFDLDESWLYFRNDAGKEHWVFLVGGNGIDLITDYSYARAGTDTFEAAMESFKPDDWTIGAD